MGENINTNFLFIGNFLWEDKVYKTYKLKDSNLESLEKYLKENSISNAKEMKVTKENYYLLKRANSVLNNFIIFESNLEPNFTRHKVDLIPIDPSYVDKMIDKYELYINKNNTSKFKIIAENIKTILQVIQDRNITPKTKIWGASVYPSADYEINDPGEKFSTANLPTWSANNIMNSQSNSFKNIYDDCFKRIRVINEVKNKSNSPQSKSAKSYITLPNEIKSNNISATNKAAAGTKQQNSVSLELLHNSQAWYELYIWSKRQDYIWGYSSGECLDIYNYLKGNRILNQKQIDKYTKIWVRASEKGFCYSGKGR